MGEREELPVVPEEVAAPNEETLEAAEEAVEEEASAEEVKA